MTEAVSADPIRLLDEARTGDQRALGRLLTIVGTSLADAARIAALIEHLPREGRGIGFVGPPGVGKSSLVAALAHELLSQERRVAVLATDPTSAHSHGALLGDRVRMKSLSRDSRIFIRSVAARDPQRSLAETTLGSVALLTRLGFDFVLVEAVGAGQSDIGTSLVVDTTVMVLVPGLGDDVQAIKSGLLELADVIVVNKSDLPDAARTAKIIRQSLHFVHPHGARIPAVVQTSATEVTGIQRLIEALAEHAANVPSGIGDRGAQVLIDLVLFEVTRRLRARLPGDRVVLDQLKTVNCPDTDVFRAALAVADVFVPA